MSGVTGWRRSFGLGLASVALAMLTGACSSVFPGPPAAIASQPVSVVRHEVAGQGGEAAGPKLDGDPVTIWLVSGSYHTGLVVPLDWLEEGGFRPPPVVKGAKWVNLSWGDRLAYEQMRWLTPWEVTAALFFPTDSVMEMIRVDFDPRWVFPDQQLIRGTAPREAGAKLAAFFENCRQGPGEVAGQCTVLGDSTWGQGCLLSSPQSYGFPRLCNSWTAGALETCGYSFDFPARVFAGSLVRKCLRQGFEKVPPLTVQELGRLDRYMKEAEQDDESNQE